LSVLIAYNAETALVFLGPFPAASAYGKQQKNDRRKQIILQSFHIQYVW